METIEGEISAAGARIGLVVARFNQAITERLLEGAQRVLRRHGVQDKDITVIHVPGAFELPLALKQMADTGRFDALVALGAVIRGETPHFDYVAGEAAAGVRQVSVETGIPIGFGLLTTDTADQALARTGIKQGNKGEEAATAALEMLSVIDQIGGEEFIRDG